MILTTMKLVKLANGIGLQRFNKDDYKFKSFAALARNLSRNGI
jgi:hypothetical protein